MGEQEDIKPVDEQRGDSVDAPVLHREDDEGESGLREDLAALIDGATPSEIAPHLENEDAADAADALEAMEPGTTAEVLHRMENEAAAEALANMALPLAVSALEDLRPAEGAALLELMADDDAADLLQELPDDTTRSLLARMEPKRAADLGKLVLYDPQTAGGLMTTDIRVVREDLTIGQALERLKHRSLRDDQYDIYVVDRDKKLTGTISLHTLVVVDDAEPVASWTERDIDTLHTGLDQEEVARLFDRYDYITMPVVDDEGRVMGMVTIDDIIDILREEQTEDAYKQVGAGVGEAVYSDVRTKLKGRFPWLVLNLLTAQAGSAAILIFHDMLVLVPVVAVIYPVIANQAGNAGQQSLAVTLRGIVLGEIRPERVTPLILRELSYSVLSGLGIGIIFGLAVSGVALMGVGGGFTWEIGVVAGMAMMGALSVSCVVGTLIPLALDKFGFDPATASSIFLTMMTDALSYLTFLGLVFLMQGWLVAAVA